MGKVTTMPMIRLFGGECDGGGQKVPFSERPDTYYAVPLMVAAEIEKTVRSPLAKKVAIEKARVLAYTFQKSRLIDSEIEYCYSRCVEKDRLVEEPSPPCND
jgi:hypothetical protein